MENLTKSLEFLTKSGFIKGLVEKNTIKNIKFLPLGTTLLDNIRNEWHKNKEELNSYPAIGIDEDFKRDSNKFSFIRSHTLRESLLHVKNHFQNDLPLIIKTENLFSAPRVVNDDETIQIDIPRETVLATNYFFTPSVALEKFYHIQRERKICWMKYSSNPSRYYLSDLVTEEVGGHKLQSLKIKSKLDSGDMEVEEIHFVPIAAMGLENESDFAMKDSRLLRDVLPTCIRSEFKLETTACALLLDSIESSRENTLAINRKIVPYQCGIFCYVEDNIMPSDMTDLSTHISNVIRKLGISALNLQKCHTNNPITLNTELCQMDRIGVPYCIILESETLRTGLMKLRSRDTTLSETIHITDVSNYLQKIFNS
ncbi:DNA polymerase subunit gamma-2, mitochondrial [Episyrphus balteatus]|uniref:DNA polymerase subunit gamma-2, mitochondrial n=1 Tax=Episyrphus balteatus TaxID=286459 RepID=UPI0024861F44|nr:DNA polymerase subunit gamma-2, mitochondrial [Episyrphus balteatus]